MDIREHKAGDFRICAKALPRPGGGYLAGVELHRVPAEFSAHIDVVYSKDSLFHGRAFEDAHSAMVAAMDVGHQMVRRLATVAA